MRIGKLAEATGATTATLRYYEDEGLLPPAERSPEGYRDYATDTIARVVAPSWPSRNRWYCASFPDPPARARAEGGLNRVIEG